MKAVTCSRFWGDQVDWIVVDKSASQEDCRMGLHLKDLSWLFTSCIVVTIISLSFTYSVELSIIAIKVKIAAGI